MHINELNNNNMSTYPENPKQTLWETWFVTSVIIMISLLIIGTTDGSKEFVPNFPYYITLSTINLMICIIIGYRKQ